MMKKIVLLALLGMQSLQAMNIIRERKQNECHLVGLFDQKIAVSLQTAIPHICSCNIQAIKADDVRSIAGFHYYGDREKEVTRFSDGPLANGTLVKIPQLGIWIFTYGDIDKHHHGWVFHNGSYCGWKTFFACALKKDTLPDYIRSCIHNSADVKLENVLVNNGIVKDYRLNTKPTQAARIPIAVILTGNVNQQRLYLKTAFPVIDVPEQELLVNIRAHIELMYSQEKYKSKLNAKTLESGEKATLVKKLFDAIDNEEIATVNQILKTYNCSQLADSKDMTALMKAAQKGNVEILSLLLEHGCLKSAVDQSGNTVLHYAARSCNLLAVIFCLTTAEEDVINKVNKNCETALMIAVEKRQPLLVEMLLNFGADVGIKDCFGRTALIRACKEPPKKIAARSIALSSEMAQVVEKTQADLMECIRMVINYALSLDETDQNGMTALLCAIESENIAAVQALIEAHADITIKRKKSALEMARDSRNSALIKLLEDAHNQRVAWFAQKAVKDQNLELIYACACNNERKVRLLLTMLPDRSLPVVFSQLHDIANIREGVYQEVIGTGTYPSLIDVNAQTTQQETALYFALFHQNYELVELLLRKGASILSEFNGKTLYQHFKDLGSLSYDVSKLIDSEYDRLTAPDRERRTAVALESEKRWKHFKAQFAEEIKSISQGHRGIWTLSDEVFSQLVDPMNEPLYINCVLSERSELTPFLCAVREGAYAVVRDMLALQGVDSAKKAYVDNGGGDRQLYNALSLALKNNDTFMLTLLCDSSDRVPAAETVRKHGEDVTDQSVRRSTERTVFFDNATVARLIIQAIDWHRQEKCNYISLLRQLYALRPECFMGLIRASLKERSAHGLFLLENDIVTFAPEEEQFQCWFFDAILHDHKTFVEYILSRYPRLVEIKHPSEGGTPLMFAAKNDRLTMVGVLCSAGADLEAVDRDGGTALHHARGMSKQYLQERLEALGKKRIAEQRAQEAHEAQLLLHQKKTQQEQRRIQLKAQGYSDLDIAVLEDELHAIDTVVIMRKYVVKRVDSAVAATTAHHDAVEKDADISEERGNGDIKGWSKEEILRAYMLATEHGCVNALNGLLTNFSSYKDGRDAQGITPLMNAVKHKQFAVAEVLIKHNAQVLLVDNTGINVCSMFSEQNDVTDRSKKISPFEVLLSQAIKKHIEDFCDTVLKMNDENACLFLRSSADLLHALKNEERTFIFLKLALTQRIAILAAYRYLVQSKDQGVQKFTNGRIEFAIKNNLTHVYDFLTDGYCLSEVDLSWISSLNPSMACYVMDSSKKITIEPEKISATAVVLAEMGNASVLRAFMRRFNFDINGLYNFGRSLKMPLIVYFANTKNLIGIKTCIEAGAHPDTTDEFGRTALIEACTTGQVEVVEFLLENRADPNCGLSKIHAQSLQSTLLYAQISTVDKQAANLVAGGTPLILAIIVNQKACVDVLLRYNVDVNARREDGATALIVACHGKLYPVVKKLLAAGARPEGSWEGKSAIGAIAYQAARFAETKNVPARQRSEQNKEYCELLELLVRHGAPVDERLPSENKETILMAACDNGALDIVKCLIRLGADIEAKDTKGLTAMHYAIDAKSHVVDFLVKKGAQVNVPSHFGITPLLSAAARPKNASVLRSLLRAGAQTHTLDNHKHTPLHYACNSCDRENIETLLEYGCAINAKNSEGLHVLSYLLFNACSRQERLLGDAEQEIFDRIAPCTFENHEPLIKFFLSRPEFDIYSRAKDDRNVLFYATQLKDQRYLRYLLQHPRIAKDKVLINQEDNECNTPLMFACGLGDVEAVRVLLTHDSIDINFKNRQGLTAFNSCLIETPKIDEEKLVLLLNDKRTKLSEPQARPFAMVAHLKGWKRAEEAFKRFGVILTEQQHSNGYSFGVFDPAMQNSTSFLMELLSNSMSQGSQGSAEAAARKPAEDK